MFDWNKNCLPLRPKAGKSYGWSLFAYQTSESMLYTWEKEAVGLHTRWHVCSSALMKIMLKCKCMLLPLLRLLRRFVPVRAGVDSSIWYFTRYFKVICERISLCMSYQYGNARPHSTSVCLDRVYGRVLCFICSHCLCLHVSFCRATATYGFTPESGMSLLFLECSPGVLWSSSLCALLLQSWKCLGTVYFGNFTPQTLNIPAANLFFQGLCMLRYCIFIVGQSWLYLTPVLSPTIECVLQPFWISPLCCHVCHSYTCIPYTFVCGSLSLSKVSSKLLFVEVYHYFEVVL